MSRLLCLLCLAALACSAETPADLAASTRGARDQAERQLADTRTRIASEQAALLGELQTAVATANAARDRLTSAQAEAKIAADQLARRLQDQDRELALVKQLADRAVVAARLGEAGVKVTTGKPPLERAAAAIAGLEARIAALPARLGLRLADETVITRDGALIPVPVLRLGEARALALGSGPSQRGILEPAADGSSWLVTGPALPDAVRIEAGLPNAIPLDAAGTAAHQAGEVHRTLGQWLAAGRAFIWPIIAVLLIGLSIVVERIIALARRRVDPHQLVAVAARLTSGDPVGARAVVGEGTTPLARVLRAGLDALGRPREAREAVVEQALLAETAQLSRGLPAIAVLAGVAPLLGLLGTVTGMIDMFSVIAAQGSGNAKSLSGGISEALICTQAGMLVAIPLLLAHAWLGRLADRRSQLLEEAACGILGLEEHQASA
jgi:biopolymer transport protein ExbB